MWRGTDVAGDSSQRWRQCPALRQQQGMALTTHHHTCSEEVGLSHSLPGTLPETAREAEDLQAGGTKPAEHLVSRFPPGDGAGPCRIPVVPSQEGRKDLAEHSWEAPALLTLYLEKVGKAEPRPLVDRGNAVASQSAQQSHQGAEAIPRTSSLQGRAAGKGSQAAPAPAGLCRPSRSLSGHWQKGCPVIPEPRNPAPGQAGLSSGAINDGEGAQWDTGGPYSPSAQIAPCKLPAHGLKSTGLSPAPILSPR